MLTIMNLIGPYHHQSSIDIPSPGDGRVPRPAPLTVLPWPVKVACITGIEPPTTSISRSAVTATFSVVVLVVSREEHAGKISVEFPCVFCIDYAVTCISGGKKLIVHTVIWTSLENPMTDPIGRKKKKHQTIGKKCKMIMLMLFYK